MRFEWTKKELAFRDEVRDFLKTHYPHPFARTKHPSFYKGRFSTMAQDFGTEKMERTPFGPNIMAGRASPSYKIIFLRENALCLAQQ